MSTPSISEIKFLLETIKSNAIDQRLMNVTYIILSVILYFLVAISFDYLNLYTQNPFNLLVKTKILPLDVIKNILVVFTLISLYFSYLIVHLLWGKRHTIIQRNNYRWDVRKGLSEWDFQGNVLVNQEEKFIHIVQSELGCIIRNRSWKNFTMSFEFKIPEPPPLSPPDQEGNKQLRRGFGIIYRAKQLGEYCMIKVDENGFLPHVRNLYWENNGPIGKHKLDKTHLNSWIPITLTVINKTLTIKMDDTSVSFPLPTHSNVTYDYKRKVEQAELHHFLPIHFSNYGSVGFRSAAFEEVFIKKLRVEEESLIELCGRKLKSFVDKM